MLGILILVYAVVLLVTGELIPLSTSRSYTGSKSATRPNGWLRAAGGTYILFFINNMIGVDIGPLSLIVLGLAVAFFLIGIWYYLSGPVF